jgi:hypothetical protein
MEAPTFCRKNVSVRSGILFSIILITTTVLGSSLAVFAQGSEREVDVRSVPGTKWTASATVDGREFVSCQISQEIHEGEVRFAIGSKGTLVMLLQDPYLNKQIQSVLGWLSPGSSYQGVLSAGKRSASVKVERIWKKTLMVNLSEFDQQIIFSLNEIALSVGGNRNERIRFSEI